MMLPKKICFNLTIFVTIFLTILTFNLQHIFITKYYGNSVIAETKPVAKTSQQVQELTLYQPLQELQWEGQYISNKGIAYFSVDNLSTSSFYESDLDEARASKDTHEIVKALAGLALSHHIEGSYDTAIDYYQQALEILKEEHDLELELMLLGNIGLAHVQSGNYYAEAIDYLNDYLTLISHSNIGQYQEAQALGNLGNAYYGADLYVEAISLHKKRLALSQKIKDQAGEVKALSDLGIIYQSLGDTKKAIEYYSQALTLARQIKNRLLESSALGNLGIFYQTQGDYAKAADYQQQRLEIARELKDLHSEAIALANLGGVAYFQGDYNKALALDEQGWKISWDTLHDADILYRIRGNQGLAYFQMGNNEKALEAYQQYFQYAYSRSNRREEGIVKINAAARSPTGGKLNSSSQNFARSN